MGQKKELSDILFDCEYISRSVLSLVFGKPNYTDRVITKAIQKKEIKVRTFTLPQQKDTSTCLSLSATLEQRLCEIKNHAEDLDERKKNRTVMKYIERRRKMVDAAMMCCLAGAIGYPKKGDHYSNIYDIQNRNKGYYPVNPFTPPGRQWEKKMMKDIIEDGGIVINRSQIREYNAEMRGDNNHFKYSSASGVFLTKTGPFMLYSATNGFLYLRHMDEYYMLEELASELHYKGVYSYNDYPVIEKAFIFLTDKPSFRAIIENKKGLSSKVFSNFNWMYLIPATLEGVNQINRMITAQSLRKKILNNLTETGLFSEKAFNYVFPLVNQSGDKVFYGVDMDLISLRELYRLANHPENMEEKYIMICYQWQVPYYNQVFAENVEYFVVDD